jgi:hypothetical protein
MSLPVKNATGQIAETVHFVGILASIHGGFLARRKNL